MKEIRQIHVHSIEADPHQARFYAVHRKGNTILHGHDKSPQEASSMKPTKEQKQHVDIGCKLALRKNLIEKVGLVSGAVYVPFVGDGDIAVELYKDMKIYGADIDENLVKTAQSRLPGSEIIQADCDAFPFKDKAEEYSLADFDAYAYPYAAFRSFWQQAKLTSPCVLFFTDGEKQAVMRAGHWTNPAGKKQFEKEVNARRAVFNKYWTSIILPWFTEYIKPWRVVETVKYSRKMEFYWGAIIERPKEKNPAAVALGRLGAQKRSGIRADKFGDIKKEIYLDLLRSGHGRTLAASKAGVCRDTICNHRQKYPAFAKAESEAECHADDAVVNALYAAAKSGNVTADQVWLYNRQPENWKDKRNVAVTGGLEVVNKDVIEDLSDADLTAIIASRRGRRTPKASAG